VDSIDWIDHPIIIQITQTGTIAIVAGISETITVAVFLAGIRLLGTVVAYIAQLIAISIRLQRISHGITIVARIADAVRIAVRL